LLLNRAASSANNIVKYVSPVFDHQYSHRHSSPQFWYHAFLTFRPINALFSFITEIRIQDIANSGITIGPNNAHTICYNYSDAAARNPAKIFSEEGRVIIQLGVTEYDYQTEDFILSKRQGNSIEAEMYELMQLTGYRGENGNLTASAIQNYLICLFNIFWLPFGINFNQKTK